MIEGDGRGPRAAGALKIPVAPNEERLTIGEAAGEVFASLSICSYIAIAARLHMRATQTWELPLCVLLCMKNISECLILSPSLFIPIN